MKTTNRKTEKGKTSGNRIVLSFFDSPFAVFFGIWSLGFGILMLPGCNEKSAKPDSSAPFTGIERIAEKGPVKMTVRFSPKEPRLSDMIDMDLIIEALPDVEIKPPDFGQGVGDFLVRDYTERAGETAAGSGKKIRRFHYQLEPAHAGKHLIRSVSMEFTDKRKDSESKGEPVLLETDPLEINVTSELGDKTPSLTDLAPMLPPKPLPPKPIWIWLGIAAGVIVLIVAALILRKRLQKAAVAVEIRRTPEEIAHEALKALLAENLPGKGLHKEFYVRLTGIVRVYIEGTTGLHAPEQTTEEFLRAMRARTIFPAERSVQLANFLEAADMVKYAAMHPGERQLEESIARAQEFVGLPSAFRPLPEPALK